MNSISYIISLYMSPDFAKSRYNDLVSGHNDLLSRTPDILSPYYDLVSSDNDLLPRYNASVSCNTYLVSCYRNPISTIYYLSLLTQHHITKIINLVTTTYFLDNSTYFKKKYSARKASQKMHCKDNLKGA